MATIQEYKSTANFLLVDVGLQTTIKIIDLPKEWKRNKELVLSPDQRVIMTKKNLKSLILDSGYQHELEKIMSNLINIDNFNNTKADAYEELINEYNTWIKETYQSLMHEQGATFDTLIGESDLVLRSRLVTTENAVIESDENIGEIIERNPEVPIKIVTKTIKKPKKPIDFKAKLRELAKDKILNITEIDKYGGGYKSIPLVKAKYWFRTKDDKVGTQNYKSLVIFNDLIGGKYNKDIERAKIHFKIQDSTIYDQKEYEKLNPSKVAKEAKSEESTEDIIKGTVDIFDFDTYSDEYTLMSKYFSDLELVLRTALFIDYKYNYLNPKDKDVFEKQLNTKEGKKAKREFIRLTLDVFEPLYLVTQWYRHFNPQALEENPKKAEQTVDKYKFHIDVMFNRMYKARFDPDWDEETKLWFSDNNEKPPKPKISSEEVIKRKK